MSQTHQTVALPAILSRYQDAHDRGDAETAVSAFTADARVHDEEREYRGTEAIRRWVTDSAAKYTYTRTRTSAERLDDGTWLLGNHLEGDFPGGVADLRYRFVLVGDRIAELSITA